MYIIYNIYIYIYIKHTYDNKGKTVQIRNFFSHNVRKKCKKSIYLKKKKSTEKKINQTHGVKVTQKNVYWGNKSISKKVIKKNL